MKINLNITLGLILANLLNCTAYAWSIADLHGVEWSAGVGPTWSQGDNSATEITTQETDANVLQHINRSTTYQVGVGYHFFQDALQTRPFLNDLFVQLNLSRNSATATGQILEFGRSDYNAFSFQAPVRSTKLMLEVEPSLFTFQHCSPYPIVGAGVSWNRSAFAETAISADDASGAVILPSHTQANFAYEVGFGVRDTLTKNINISLEYLSTHLGKMTPNAASTSTQAILSAPSFSVRNQNVLLTLGWKF